MKLEEIKVGDRIEGLVPDQIATIIQTVPIGDDALTLYYSTPSKPIEQQVIYREDAERIHPAGGKGGYLFDAPADRFKLGLEALRLSLGACVDPMIAVDSSKIEPLPHQISAVYERMLPRRPLRFVLADDPGAGKTVMAGLLIKEMILRADARRVLVVAPGALVEQWQDELNEKFDLPFELFSAAMRENSRTGNPFNEYPLLIARLDQLARSQEYQDLIERADEWDLVIIDEAHKCSASRTSGKVDRTKRYETAELLARKSRHYLMMTATPHNGKDSDFRLWLALLDSDRFAGPPRDDTRLDVGDVMRRLVKEQLKNFDGTALFPPRCAYTANYDLSEREMALYQHVTRYVRTEMNRAKSLDGKRRGRVGFALTLLQRRLASSPKAILESLARRCERLNKQLELGGFDDPRQWHDIQDPEDELTAEEYEKFVDQVSGLTASRSPEELLQEIEALKRLVAEAMDLVRSGEDSKWRELQGLFRTMEGNRDFCDLPGQMRKLIIFTEHRDTLEYLKEKITNHLGLERRDAVVIIHGGIGRDTRRKVQEEFCNNPEVRVLIATDAAGEGVNLQRANLMINYDLPWNPNRIEQRFGRIHRIGQTLPCHLWNLVAHQTREGRVFETLFAKLENQRKALGDQVFDVLGEIFEDVPLSDLLIQAICSEDDDIDWPKRKIEDGMSADNLKEMIRRKSLVPDLMKKEDILRVKAKMDEALARKLQPCYICGFVLDSLKALGGDIRKRENAGRFQIRSIPRAVRESDRVTANTREVIASKYERVCFEKDQIQPNIKFPRAEFLHLGHPLVRALIDAVRMEDNKYLSAGTVLINPNDPGTRPSVVLMLEHKICESEGSGLASHRLIFVRVTPDGNAASAGYAPHLDMRLPSDEERAVIAPLVNEPWLGNDLSKKGIDFATALLKQTVAEVTRARREYLDKAWEQTYECLTTQIDQANERARQLDIEVAAGRQPRVQPENFRARARNLAERLDKYRSKIERQKLLRPESPTVLGAYLEVPQGWLDIHLGGITPENQTADAQDKKRIEKLAMDAVIACERKLGNHPIDVSGDNCGWDITSRRPDGAEDRCIEVKGRDADADTVGITYNEFVTASNLKEKHILAIVLVHPDGTVEDPLYIKNSFGPDIHPTSQNYALRELLGRAVRPEETM